MSDDERLSNYKKIVEFIPLKTLSMDLESILANLTKMYVNRNETDMIELIASSQPELFPIGSFDSGAEKYEYALKLALSAEFFNHLKNDIGKIQKQIMSDLTVITAPYVHEFIREVFIVIKIVQDSKWRDEIFDLYLESESSAHSARAPAADMVLFHAPADGNGIVAEMKTILIARGCSVDDKVLTSIKDKDIHHVLKDFEKASRFGVCIISKAFMELPFSHESINLIVSYILNPGKRLYQIWDNVNRTDVVNFNAALARSLVYSTERMTVEAICDYLLKVAGLKEANRAQGAD
jgi:hypothetical protein